MLPKNKTRTIEEIEKEALNVLQVKLSEPLRLLDATFNLVGKAVVTPPKEALRVRNVSTRLVVLLLIRLVNELRCISWLAKRGYAPQAATLGASMYEIGYTIACIGANDELAQRWFDHNELLTMPFGNMFAMTETALANIGVPNVKKQALSEYKIYTQFCMAKHGNPLFQGQYGYRLVEGKITPMNGPDTSDRSLNVAWFTLEKSVVTVLVACKSFVLNHVPLVHKNSLDKKIVVIGMECKRLGDIAIQRWGKKDPFPGKWKH